MKKRLLALALALVMAVSLMPAAFAAGEVSYAVEGGNIYFDPASGTVTGSDETVTAAHIPASINGVPVTAIGYRAFFWRENLTDLTLPDTVTTLYSDAFNSAVALRHITLPSGITEIPYNAFYNCKALETVTLQGNVTAIGKYAFDSCDSLKSINLPASLRSIARSAFSECVSLQSIVIPYGVTRIEEWTFNCCESLKSVSIPETVTFIGEKAFQYCTSLSSVTIPDSVTTIGARAFAECTALKSVKLPANLKSMEGAAFAATGLTSLTVPGSLKSISSGTFSHCFALKNVTVQPGVQIISEDAFFRCEALESISIPNTVTTIGKSAFYNCVSLANVTIPASVTKIGDLAFLRSMQTITAPAGSTAHQYALDGGFAWADAANPSGGAAVARAVATTQMVTVDGRQVKFETYALREENGYLTNYIKLRDVACTLMDSPIQFNVSWSGGVKITTGVPYEPDGSEMHTPFSGDRPYRVNTGKTRINGAEVTAHAIILEDDNGGGYTYYKLRDLGRLLGFNVGWSAQAGMYLQTDRPYTDAD